MCMCVYIYIYVCVYIYIYYKIFSFREGIKSQVLRNPVLRINVWSLKGW